MVGQTIPMWGYGEYANEQVFGVVVEITDQTLTVDIDADPFPSVFRTTYNRATGWPLEGEAMGRIDGFRPQTAVLGRLLRVIN